jgi:hypothetical protein
LNFELERRALGHGWRLVDSRGQVVARSSQSYGTRAKCLRSVAEFREVVRTAAVVDVTGGAPARA